MNATQAIKMKADYEARKRKAKEETWKAIEHVRDEILRQELKKAFPCTVKNTNKRSG